MDTISDITHALKDNRTEQGIFKLWLAARGGYVWIVIQNTRGSYLRNCCLTTRLPQITRTDNRFLFRVHRGWTAAVSFPAAPGVGAFLFADRVLK
jgi:hypothetical protein